MRLLTFAARSLVAASLIGVSALGCPPIAAASPATPDPAGNAADLQKLMGLLSTGYSAANCNQVGSDGNGDPTAVVQVDCGQNPDTGGPVGGRYGLFADQHALNGAFQAAIGTDVLAPCSAGVTSPGTWSYGSSASGPVAGSLSCGTYNGAPEVAWTNNANLTLGVVDGAAGSDIATLYRWWKAEG